MTMATKTLKLSTSEITSEDLIISILLRVPIRSLIRFQLVSKDWESLIKSPTFSKQIHYANPISATGLFVPWSYNDRKNFPIPVQSVPFDVENSKNIPSLKLKMKLIQSCNGLLLGSINSEYYVYNPTTKKSMTLPALAPVGKDKQRVPYPKVRSMCLAFDPDVSPYYKVVCVLESGGSVFNVHVYSSETGIWTSNGERYERGVNVEGVYWNGCVHWFFAGTYYDIENQRMEELIRPPLTAWRYKYYFGESFGRLYYARICLWDDDQDPDVIEIWEMLRDHSGWICKYRVDVDFRPLGEGSWIKYNPAKSVLSVVRGEEEGDDTFVVIEMGGGEVVRYNIVSKTYKTLHIFPGKPCHRAFQYIESLCSV